MSNLKRSLTTVAKCKFVNFTAIFVVSFFLLGMSAPPPPPADVSIVELDFHGSDYTIFPTFQLLNWGDEKHFEFILTLSAPTTRKLIMRFALMAKRDSGDIAIGTVYTEIEPNRMSPRMIFYSNWGENGSTARIPTNSPEWTTDRTVWLACRRDGNLRGNYSHVPERSAIVYLSLSSISYVGRASGEYVVDTSLRSPEHRVSCERPTPPPSNDPEPICPECDIASPRPIGGEGGPIYIP